MTYDPNYIEAARRCNEDPSTWLDETAKFLGLDLLDTFQEMEGHFRWTLKQVLDEDSSIQNLEDAKMLVEALLSLTRLVSYS